MISAILIGARQPAVAEAVDDEVGQHVALDVAGDISAGKLHQVPRQVLFVPREIEEIVARDRRRRKTHSRDQLVRRGDIHRKLDREQLQDDVQGILRDGNLFDESRELRRADLHAVASGRQRDEEAAPGISRRFTNGGRAVRFEDMHRDCPHLGARHGTHGAGKRSVAGGGILRGRVTGSPGTEDDSQGERFLDGHGPAHLSHST